MTKKDKPAPPPTSASVCYTAPACPAIPSSSPSSFPAPSPAGFTNVTGFSTSTPDCCQICPPPPSASTLPSYLHPSLSSSPLSSSSSSTSSTSSGFDYVILDLLWLPQFCAALEQGIHVYIYTIYTICCNTIYTLYTLYTLYKLCILTKYTIHTYTYIHISISLSRP